MRKGEDDAATIGMRQRVRKRVGLHSSEKQVQGI